MTTKDIGDIGEAAAARFLKRNGYKIIGKNLHFSHNEIDVIAEDKSYIVFVEVKTRTVSESHATYASPASAVTYAKQSRLISAAYDYMRQKPTKKQPRMDVIEVWLDKETKEVIDINHIYNAYGAN